MPGILTSMISVATAHWALLSVCLWLNLCNKMILECLDSVVFYILKHFEHPFIPLLYISGLNWFLLMVSITFTTCTDVVKLILFACLCIWAVPSNYGSALCVMRYLANMSCGWLFPSLNPSSHYAGSHAMESLWDLHFFWKWTYWEISISIIRRPDIFYTLEARSLLNKENKCHQQFCLALETKECGILNILGWVGSYPLP